MQDLKEIHEKPHDKFDIDLATEAAKTRCIKQYGLLVSSMRGRALQLVKAVEYSIGFGAWRSLNKALEPTSKARGLALLGAATTWPAFSMNSALQPQLLKLEEVFDETVKAGTAIEEELKSAILFEMCGWTTQVLFELGNWRRCSIPNFEGTCVATGWTSTEVGYFHGG